MLKEVPWWGRCEGFNGERTKGTPIDGIWIDLQAGPRFALQTVADYWEETGQPGEAVGLRWLIQYEKQPVRVHDNAWLWYVTDAPVKFLENYTLARQWFPRSWKNKGKYKDKGTWAFEAVEGAYLAASRIIFNGIESGRVQPLKPDEDRMYSPSLAGPPSPSP
jgi:hypothetical protein